MSLDTIGKNIRKYRKSRRLRQEDLAEMTGLSMNYIGSLERGEKLPSLETFIVIANALDVTADMLLCDVVSAGYTLKASLLTDKIEELTPDDKSRIFDVVDVLIKHSEQDNIA